MYFRLNLRRSSIERSSSYSLANFLFALVASLGVSLTSLPSRDFWHSFPQPLPIFLRRYQSETLFSAVRHQDSNTCVTYDPKTDPHSSPRGKVAERSASFGKRKNQIANYLGFQLHSLPERHSVFRSSVRSQAARVGLRDVVETTGISGECKCGRIPKGERRL